MRRIWSLLLLLPVLITAIVLGLYLYKFGSVADPTLSSLMEDWGQFGDYIAGTLGTYFALLAFLAAWVAVVFQSDQLQLARARTDTEPLERLMASSADQLDLAFFSRLRPGIGPLHARIEQRKVSMTLHETIAAAAVLHVRERTVAEVIQHSEVLDALGREAPLIVLRLQHLVQALRVYAERGGSAAVCALYLQRYQIEVYWLHVLGLLCSDIVRNYFNPDAVGKAATEEAERVARAAGGTLAA